MHFRICVTLLLAVAAVQEPVRWSADRRLAWSDFRGTPRAASAASAMTAYVTSYVDGCDGDAYWREVYVAFLPNESWVKTDVLMQGGSQALEHERTHFDLGEVHARKLRRALDALEKPCEMSEAARSTVVTEFLKLDRDTQSRFDVETQFGVDSGRQVEWSRRVARDLAQLRAFAAARK